MLKNDIEKFVIFESSRFLGAYVVINVETMEETLFHNLASAKTYLRSIKRNV